MLARAGHTTPLDLDIEMSSRYWDKANIDLDNWEQQVNSLIDLFDFLAGHGAASHRWRSFTVRARHPEVLFRFIELLNVEPPRFLQYLGLEWILARERPSEESRCLSYPKLLTGSHSLPGVSFPSLRSVKFEHVPWGFVFYGKTPLLGHLKLTSLNLTAAAQLTSTTRLQELLVACPMLKFLVLDSGYGRLAVEDSSSGLNQEYPRVRLTSLQSLSIGSSSCPFWVLGVLRMIEAPILHKFTFPHSPPNSVFDEPSGCELVIHYVCTSRLPQGCDEPTGAGSTTLIRPIYPSLSHLDISNLWASNDSLREMLSYIPSVTCLTIQYFKMDILRAVPWVLPNLAHLRIAGEPEEHKLRELLRYRAKAGFPLQAVTVEIESLFWTADQEVKLEGVALVRYRDRDLDLDRVQ